MADDRYRRVSTHTTPPAPGATRAAAAAARQPGPDPLVELARLIGQNETPSRTARGRDEREAADPRIAQRRQAAPSQPAPDQGVPRRTSAPSPLQRRQAAPSQPLAPEQVAQRRTAAPSPPVPEQALQRRQAIPSQPAPDQGAQRRTAPPPQPTLEQVLQRRRTAPPPPTPEQALRRRTVLPPQPTLDQAAQRDTAPPPQSTPDQAAPRGTAALSQAALEQALRRRTATPSQPLPGQVVQRHQATPRQPAPEPDVERAPQYERYPDQHYDGYTEPASPSQGRGQTRVGHPQDIAPPDLSDPYRTDAGWRAPRPKERTARPDRGAGAPAAYAGDARSPAEQAPVQALAPTPPAVTDSTRPPTPMTADHSYYEPTAERAYEPGACDDARAVAGEPGAQPERHDEHDDFAEIDSQPRGRKLRVAVAVLALAVIGTAGAYTYRSMVGTEEQKSPPPVIRADTSPKKIASATQQSSNEKQIQERLGGAGATSERLVSREEQPLAIKDPNARALVPEPPPALSAPVTTAPSNARPFPTPDGAANEPKKIRTVTIRPEGDNGDTARPGSSAAAAPATPAPARAARPAAPASSGEPQSTAPQAAPARTQTAVATPQPRPSASNYVVQISAQKSESDAQASFRIMQSKYPSVLGGRQAIIRRKESSKGVYYGTQVGPFAGREEAIQLCEALKAAGGNCFVLRN